MSPQMADTTKWVWIKDEESVFKKAVIVNEDGETATVRDEETGELRKVQLSDLDRMNPPQFEKVGDMAELTYLNEPSVVENLRNRWLSGDIYTYSGLFLVAVNPYRPLNIYDENTIKQIRGKRRDECKPHIYAIAEEAFTSMLETRRDQSILITGESGAGKTENTKKTIQYLSGVSHGDETGGIDARILETNPILEAFGNAQTIRNSNSSRFGKFIKIQFGREKQTITGASIQWYLLEKSRVVTQHADERNYHVFYQLIKGASPKFKERLGIDASATPNEFRYLASGVSEISGVDDAQLYHKLVNAFKLMGFQEADIEAIMEIVASVLLLGEIKFRASSADQGSVVDMAAVETVSRLLGLDSEVFIKSVLQPRVKIGREYTTQSRNASQAQHTTNAVAKALYEKLFGYIVEQLNARLGKENLSACSIGVLDIAGFEIFEVNSFEQLCINYTNEKLQQFFNHHMFVLEQEEYVREEVDWDYVDYGRDLQPTIDLIEQTKSPMGIFSCLNEESVLPSGSDVSFNEKLAKQWNGSNAKFSPSRLGQGFKIDHYAQTVEYNIDGWIEKNKDPLSDAVESVLSASSNKLVSQLFDPEENTKTKGAKSNIFRTVAQRHKEQLSDLMNHLEATQPHFVRCILPNASKSSTLFDKRLVLDQLRYNGVLEGIRIARSGFPNRLEFSEFNKRYKALSSKGSSHMASQQGCASILQQTGLDPSEYKVGLSKVFFRNGVLAKLEHMLEELLLQQALALQALCRGAMVRIEVKNELHRRHAAKVISKCFQLNEKYSRNPWWQFSMGMKPLLMSKDSMDNSKKELRMQKLENTLHRLKEEQLTLISSKNELRGELIAALKANEDLSKTIEESKKERKEQQEAHELAILSARSRDEASSAALNELTERHSQLREQLEASVAANEELQRKLDSESKEVIANLRADLDSITQAHTVSEEERKTLVAKVKESDQKEESLKAKIEDLESSLSRVSSELDETKSELQAVKEKFRTLEKSTSDANSGYLEKIATFEKQLQEKEMLLESERATHNEMTKRVHSELDVLKSKQQTIQKSYEEKISELEDTKRKFSDLEQSSSLKSEEVTKLKNWLTEAKSELKEAAVTSRRLLDLEVAHKEYKEKSALTQGELESRIKSLEKTNSELKAQQANLIDPETHQKLIGDSKKLTDDLNTKISSLRTELTSEKANSSKLQEKLKAADSELERAMAKLSNIGQRAEPADTPIATGPNYAAKSTGTTSVMRILERENAYNDKGTTDRDHVRSGRDYNASVATRFDLSRKLAEVRKELAVTKKELVKAQAQPATMQSRVNVTTRSESDEDIEQELAVLRHELAQSSASIQELKAELETAKRGNAQAIIMQQKYEKLQREKAMLARDRSHLILGVQMNKEKSHELEIAKSRASEVKKLQSEINVLKLKLVRSERDRKTLENQIGGSGAPRSGDSAVENLVHRLRLAEIARLQLSKTVHELTKKSDDDDTVKPASRISTQFGDNSSSLSVKKRDAGALRNISNDRRVSEQTHLAAEHVKTKDLEEALEIYKFRSHEFHAKLEKAEIAVESAIRAEKTAKNQVEEYKERLERLADDHNAEITALRKEIRKSRKELDAKDTRIQELTVKSSFTTDLQSQIKSLNHTLKELGTERDRLAVDKARLEKRLHDIVSTYDQQPRQLQERISALKQNEQHMMREHGELRWKLERKARLVDQLRHSLMDADARIEQCRGEVERLQSKESELEIELRRANREVAESNEKYLMAERELEEYRLSRRSTLSKEPAFI